MEKTYRRGQIYYADLNPVIGSEQGGIRPVLIISNDIGNRYSPTVIVAAITSRARGKTKLPTHIPTENFDGLEKNSIIFLEQIRTIDKQRLKSYLGIIPENIMARVDTLLPLVFRFAFVRIENVQSERNNGNRTLVISRLYFYNLSIQSLWI